MGSENYTASLPEPIISVPPIKTLPEYLLTRAASYAEDANLYYAIDATSKEKRYFSQFEPETRKIASALYKRGMRKGDFVIYMPSEMIKLHIFFTGVWRANGICRASYPDDVNDETLADRIMDIKCKFVLCDTNHVERVKEAVKNVGWTVEIITTEDHPDCLSLGNILERDDGESCPSLEVNGDDPALIFCTSGTTGKSKGAIFNHSALIKHVHWISHMQMFSKTKPNVLFSTATHYTGAVLTFVLLACGKTAIITGKITKELFWKTAHEMKPGSAFAFPTYLMSLVAPEANEFDFSSLDYLLTGGGVVTPAVKSALLQLPNVKEVVNIYGLSECGIIATSAVLSESSENITYEGLPDFSAGKPIPGTLIQVKDVETLETLGPNKKGEICVYNTALFSEYLNNPEATEKTFIGKYLRTGDIGYFDENNFIYIVDRLKEIFKYYNNHISPSELENVIGQHPLVDEVCVVGVPDPGGDVPRAFVTIKGNQTDTLSSEIIKFTHAKLPSYKHLRGGLYIIPELPKGKTGKVTRNLVAQLQV